MRGVWSVFIVYGVTKLSGYFAKDLFQLAFQFDLGAWDSFNSAWNHNY